MKTKMTLIFICSLFCFFGCKNEKSNKSSTTNTEESIDSDANKAIDALVKTNLNFKNNIKQGLAKGNDGVAIANWFPKKLLEYSLDLDKNDIGQGTESRAGVVYVHPNNPSKNITINVWDGNGALAVFVTYMIAVNLDGTGEEKNSQLYQKIYVRNGRKAAEREIFQSSQVDISFEVDGRFYVTVRSGNNTLETLWKMADLLDFNALK
jgi:hypothetical protein